MATLNWNEIYAKAIADILDGLYQIFSSPEMISLYKELLLSKIETIIITAIIFSILVFIGFSERKSKKISNVLTNLWSVFDVFKK